MNQTRHIQLFFFDAGGGHRAAAEALKTSLTIQFPHWRVDVVNLQEILKSSDPLFILTGVPAENYYNAALKLGLTYGSRPFLRGLQTVIKLCASRIEEALQSFWRAHSKPDAVVSLVPNFNGVMFGALRVACPGTPYVTVMTDMADCPPHFWHEKQDQYLICGTSYAAKQAQATGWYRPERVFQTSGMIVRPSFYNLPSSPRRTRAGLGLAPDRLTALIMFGGYGSTASKTIVERLGKLKRGIQTIVMCGKNEELRASLQGIEGCHAVGFTADVADYMRLADFFIGKPGPGSLSEAWLMGLPTIVERNAGTMIQERPNIILMEQMGTGLAVSGFRSIGRAIRDMLDFGQLEQMRANVRAVDNRAVFEIPAILDSIIKGHTAGADVIPLAPRRKLATRLAQKWKRRRRA